MITLIATVKVKEGMMDQAVAVLKEIVPAIKAAEPGCLEYIPHKVRNEDNAILFYEKYADKDALKAHSARLGESLAKLLPLLDPGMDIKTCFEIIE